MPRLIDLSSLVIDLARNGIMSFILFLVIINASQHKKADNADKNHQDKAGKDFEKMFVYHVNLILPRQRINKNTSTWEVFLLTILFLN